MRFAELALAGLLLNQALAAEPAAYDSVAAMETAGRQVPAHVESYSFFLLDSLERLGEDTKQLSERLVAAAAEHDYIGLTGPDPERNRGVLRKAMAANAGRSLNGLTLIYLGPARDAEAVRALFQNSGVDLRYVVFPAEPEN